MSVACQTTGKFKCSSKLTKTANSIPEHTKSIPQVSFEIVFHLWKLCPHLGSILQNIPEAALCIMKRKNSLVCQLMLGKKLLILFALCLRLPLSSTLWNECNWICIQMHQTPWVTVRVRSRRSGCNRQFSKDNSPPLMLFWGRVYHTGLERRTARWLLVNFIEFELWILDWEACYLLLVTI